MRRGSPSGQQKRGKWGKLLAHCTPRAERARAMPSCLYVQLRDNQWNCTCSRGKRKETKEGPLGTWELKHDQLLQCPLPCGQVGLPLRHVG